MHFFPTQQATNMADLGRVEGKKQLGQYIGGEAVSLVHQQNRRCGGRWRLPVLPPRDGKKLRDPNLSCENLLVTLELLSVP